MSAPDFYAELRALRLERVLDAAVAIITEGDPDGLGMTAVAKQSGVPRRSLHREVGTKADLGRAVVDREGVRFLNPVRDGLAAHPDSVADGLADAEYRVLELGRANAVLAAVLRPGRDRALLELLTVHPDAVLGEARSVVTSLLDGATRTVPVISAQWPPGGSERRRATRGPIRRVRSRAQRRATGHQLRAAR